MTEALVLVTTLGVVVALAALAKQIKVPYPIACVLGGVALGLFPSLPHPHFDPDTILMLVLPPLLFGAAWTTDWFEFKRNRAIIALMAVGLVIFTMLAVAVVARRIPGFSWPIALTLGAIVSPPDAVAAEAVFSLLTVPRRIVSIIGGECLLNDATALVLYRFTVAAALTGTFVVGSVTVGFVLVAAGGVLTGLACGFLIEGAIRFLRRTSLDEPTIVNVLLILAPYASYLPAEALHCSGVLAAVSAGLLLSRRSTAFVDSEARITGNAIWQLLLFLLNAFVFVLIGLQLPGIVDMLGGGVRTYLVDAVLVSLVVVAVRFMWVFASVYGLRLIPRIARSYPRPRWQGVTIVAWAGMRGVVSLAVALALPYEFGLGSAGPVRGEVIFFTFCVIIVTLVGQGLTLNPLIHWLGVSESSAAQRSETELRVRALEEGIARIRALEERFSTPAQWEVAGRLLGEYEHRIEQLRGRLDAAEATSEREEVAVDRSLQKEALDAERRAIARMRAGGEIPDEIYRSIEYDLDLADVRLA
ncbi:MAG TPA: Na+/H+ antiporter [Verrucomicrobiae bacterium]|nr:Na+/H+ antiporter [Verrucomicrobiae bacterium]